MAMHHFPILSLFLSDGEFVVPTIFLTNGGNALRASKAHSLSALLDVEIKETQVYIDICHVFCNFSDIFFPR